MPKWPHDDTASKRAFYGDFRNKEWAALNLIRVYPPFKMYYDKKPVNGVLVHKKCAAAFQAAFAEIWEKADVFQALRDDDALKGKCGCCEFRHVCMGCRARAYAATGDFMASEPFCVYQPKAYVEVK